MKTNQLFSLLFLLSLIIFLSTCCPEPVEPVELNCVGNYQNTNGDCQCPDNYFEIGNEASEYSCIEKREGVFLMKSEGCFCDSEFIFEMDLSDTSSVRDFTLYFNGESYLNFPTSLNYIEKEDGDEIQVNGTGDMKCADGILYTIEMTGKFNPERTEMTAEVNFLRLENNAFIESGSCTFLLTK